MKVILVAGAQVDEAVVQPCIGPLNITFSLDAE
jgi:hypothetical protein